MESALVVDTSWEPQCAARHLTMWAAEPSWIMDIVGKVKAGILVAEASRSSSDSQVLYERDTNGIAHIPIVGPMMKFDSKFGGTNTVRTRRALREAASDKDVSAIVLHIDSPGGTSEGTDSLAAEVKRANLRKPVVAQAEDNLASAAYYVASQAKAIYATRDSFIGSIGTYAVIEDSSGKLEAEGIKVHVVSTGDYKGAFVDGAPVTAKHLKFAQDIVDKHFALFAEAVKTGRRMDDKEFERVSDGRFWIAQDAQRRGLIDGIQTTEQTVSSLVTEMDEAKAAARRSRKSKLARAAINGVRMADDGLTTTNP